MHCPAPPGHEKYSISAPQRTRNCKFVAPVHVARVSSSSVPCAAFVKWPVRAPGPRLRQHSPRRRREQCGAVALRGAPRPLQKQGFLPYLRPGKCKFLLLVLSVARARTHTHPHTPRHTHTHVETRPHDPAHLPRRRPARLPVPGCRVIYACAGLVYRERPYHAERTGTHSNAEVKLCRARLVLARGTSWEP